MTWAGNEIFFVSADGFMRVPAEGGTPVRVDIGSDERVQRVQLLPDGDTLLLTILPPGESVERWSNAQIVARSLESGARKLLVKGASDGWYVATGHLLYMIEGRLHAVSFDPSRLEISGPAVAMVEGVRRASLNLSGLGMFSVSSTGALVYMPGPASLASSQSDVGIVERNGTLTPLKLPPAPYRHPRVSPDGKRIVVETDDGKDAVVRVYDLVRGGALQRITFAGRNRFPIWTADSRRVTFQSDRDGDHGILWQVADGSSNAERLTTAAAGERHIPESWHPGGEVLFFSVAKDAESTLWTYSVRDKRTTQFGGVRSPMPTDAIFAPDGKWVAYTSGPFTTATIYVQPFPATGARYELPRTSSGAPHHPVWTSDKTLIVNQRAGTLDVVAVTTAPSFSFGDSVSSPRKFQTGPPNVRRTFDATPDGRLVGLFQAGDLDSPSATRQFTVVLNWLDELKARVPGR